MPDIQGPPAWRNIRKCRQLKRPVGRRRNNDGINQIHGYPAALIAEWCCGSVSTAYAYKSGRLKPSKAAAKLFRMHRDRMILTPTPRKRSRPRASYFGGIGKKIRHACVGCNNAHSGAPIPPHTSRAGSSIG